MLSDGIISIKFIKIPKLCHTFERRTYVYSPSRESWRPNVLIVMVDYKRRRREGGGGVRGKFMYPAISR